MPKWDFEPRVLYTEASKNQLEHTGPNNKKITKFEAPLKVVALISFSTFWLTALWTLSASRTKKQSVPKVVKMRFLNAFW